MGRLTSARESALRRSWASHVHKVTAPQEGSGSKKSDTEEIEDRADLNTGATTWSDMDILDLANCLRLNQPVEEIAGFMCRSRREIRDKIAELEQPGELFSLDRKGRC